MSVEPVAEAPGDTSAIAPVTRPVAAVAERRGLAPFAVWSVLVVPAAKCALNFAFASRYGWQRDALSYAVAGLHLLGGYVDFAPVTALMSAAARELFAWSLAGFRAFAILAGAATVVLAALAGERRHDRPRCGGEQAARPVKSPTGSEPTSIVERRRRIEMKPSAFDRR